MVKFGGISGEQLRQIVSKIEKLEEEKKEVAECIKDAYSEAKAHGYDVKVLRKLISLRKRKVADIMEEEEILDLYKHALGMVPSNDYNESEEEYSVNKISAEA